MATISNREMTVLGLICEKPMHGYEIEKVVEMRDMRYWTEISLSSIYKILKKLEQKGFIKSEIKLAKNNISQKIYTITKHGQKAMKNQVKENLSNVEKIIWQVDISMTNIFLLDHREVIDCFNKYINSINKRMKIYKDLKKDFEEKKYHESSLSLAVRPLLHLEAEKKWALDYRKKQHG